MAGFARHFGCSCWYQQALSPGADDQLCCPAAASADAAASAMCTSRPGRCQQLPGSCDPAQGYCAFEPQPAGTPCLGGVCDASGQCVSAGEVAGMVVHVPDRTALAVNASTPCTPFSSEASSDLHLISRLLHRPLCSQLTIGACGVQVWRSPTTSHGTIE